MSTPLWIRAFEDALPAEVRLALVNAVISDVLDQYLGPAHMDYYETARAILWAMYLRRSHVQFRGVDAAFVRKNGFQALVEQVSHAGLSLVFQEYDEEHMQALNQLCATEHNKKVAQITAYGFKTYAELEKTLPPDLLAFFHQCKRRRHHTQLAFVAAAAGNSGK
jgi:hypothetical protein